MKIDKYQKLYKIFSDKDWHSKKEFNNHVFNNFCNLLSHLNETQQDLIIELTQRYDWLSFNEYNSTLIKLFNDIPQQEINLLRKVYLFPIVRRGEEELTKSGHGILLMFRGIKPFLDKFSHIKFVEVEQFDFFNNPFSLKTDEQIFLLDDFLGSGSTLDSTITELFSRGITVRKIRVLSIASHIQAIEYMKSENINFTTSLITKKGISEFYSDESIKAEKLEIMNQIEKLLPTKKYNLGFGKSEALVTLYRTPNNTFPIFWHDRYKDDEKFQAPFPRF